MTESIMEWARRIVIFYIMTDLFTAAVPGKGCKKHIKLCAGIMLVLIIAEPLLSLAKGRFDLSSAITAELNNAYAADMKMWTGAAGIDENTVLEPYIASLEKMLDEKAWEYALYVQKCDIDICTDKDSSDYGKIQSVYAEVSQCRKDAIRVENIEIGKKAVSSENKDCIALKNYISEQWNVDDRNVTVVCQT